MNLASLDPMLLSLVRGWPEEYAVPPAPEVGAFHWPHPGLYWWFAHPDVEGGFLRTRKYGRLEEALAYGEPDLRPIGLRITALIAEYRERQAGVFALAVAHDQAGELARHDCPDPLWVPKGYAAPDEIPMARYECWDCGLTEFCTEHVLMERTHTRRLNRTCARCGLMVYYTE